MKPIKQEIRLSCDSSGPKITVSVRGKICEELLPLLGKYDLLDALDALILKNPDDYTHIQHDLYSITFGRKDDQGTLPDW